MMWLSCAAVLCGIGKLFAVFFTELMMLRGIAEWLRNRRGRK